MPENGEEQIITAGELGIDPEELWQAADKLRGSIDAAEYKHVVLGLIFLKYISDAFEAKRAALREDVGGGAGEAGVVGDAELVGRQHRVALEPWVEQDHHVFDFEAKTCVAEPGDFHEGPPCRSTPC